VLINIPTPSLADGMVFVHGNDCGGFPTTRGSGDNWKSDTFAAQLIGHTFIAGMLEPTYGNHLILDLSGEGFSTGRMQVLKRAALAIAPKSLLRARGFLETGVNGPKLTGVEVQVEPQKWLKFEPKDGTRWIMAKVTLFALANFLLQCFHTGIHLYTGAVTSAIKRSIPVGTNFGKAIQPNTLQTIFALFEQAAALHASHGAAFSGSVAGCWLYHGSFFWGGPWPKSKGPSCFNCTSLVVLWFHSFF